MGELPVIHWFRRDLRLTDNLALRAAFKSGAPVIPLFIFDPALLQSKRAGQPRTAFMLRALYALDANLREYGSRLFVRFGNPADVIPKLVEATNVEAVYVNRDYSPFARQRDAAVNERLNVPVYAFDDALVLAPGTVLKTDGSPYTVFTPFKNAWLDYPKPSESLADFLPERFYNPATNPDDNLPSLTDSRFAAPFALPEVSETAALRRLETFVERDIYAYATLRNSLNAYPLTDASPGGTSFLSPYLRFGLLSARMAYQAARAAYKQAANERQRDSVSTWINELIWREFFTHILYHFPHVTRHNFRRQYDKLEWRDAPNELQAWKDGLTGYPIVDAAMRQLTETGWIPNRARMIVASFLCKDLLIDWRAGERYFMERLIDGEPAANNGGWQWSAGTGTDAQPYFRIFNPVAQSRKFDADGTYIRQWIPELRHVPDSSIHAPWEMESPPANYPPPIVDHRDARERTLAAFRRVKQDR